MIYLLVKKWRGSINITSMRYFASKEDLAAWVTENTDHDKRYMGQWDWHHAYRVPSDDPDQNATHLSLAEMREVGLRPPRGSR